MNRRSSTLRLLSLCSAAMLLCLVTSTTARADERAAAAAFEALLTKVQNVMPAGWQADITPAVDVRGIREDTPVLIIQSREKLEVEIIAPSAPALLPGQVTPTHKQIVTLRFECQPYISRQKYSELQLANEQKRLQRVAFQKQHLQDIPWAAKTSMPFPPRSFAPRNQAERKLIRQYQFLWLQTAPQKLPTHSHGGLAFQMQRDWYLHMIDKQEATKFAKLMEEVQKIITPYETASQ